MKRKSGNASVEMPVQWDTLARRAIRIVNFEPGTCWYLGDDRVTIV